MKKRASTIIYILTILALSAFSFLLHPVSARTALATVVNPQHLGSVIEDFFQHSLPFADTLRDVCLQLRMAGGAEEFDGIVLANDGLIENFAPSGDSSLRKGNTAAVRRFAEDSGIPTHLMIVPTACAIYQEQLPARLDLYNQKRFIEETYRSLSGQVTAIDVYPALYSARGDYLYYRSDSRLTSLGGYTVYQTMAKRLGLTPYQEFSLDRVSHDFYGDLYDRWGYGGVKPDIITLYHNQSAERSFEVYHWDRYEERTYYSLYPAEAAVSGGEDSIILGGHSPRIEITAVGAPGQSLLVLGDRDTLSYLPFLAPHYSKITYLDLTLLTQWEIEDLAAYGYDQVLFSCDLSSYLNTDIFSRAAGMTLTAPEEPEAPQREG